MAYLCAMKMRDWRLAKKLGFAETARGLGITGVNPGGTFARIENGARQAGADLVERIIVFTNGEVTAADMHATRLAWLRENRPDKFSMPAEPVHGAEPERPAAGDLHDFDAVTTPSPNARSVGAGPASQAGTGLLLQEMRDP